MTGPVQTIEKLLFVKVYGDKIFFFEKKIFGEIFRF